MRLLSHAVPLVLLLAAGKALASSGSGAWRGGGGGAGRASVDSLPMPASPGLAAGPGWLSYNDLVALALSVGFSGPAADRAARIAWRESRGNPGAARIVTPAEAPALRQLPERSFGLWQVNCVDPKGNPIRSDETALLDPAYNARVAFTLSRGGTSWGPWNLR